MVADKINKLREKLEEQLLRNEPYEKIYKTSTEIDKLVTEYYQNKELTKSV